MAAAAAARAAEQQAIQLGQVVQVPPAVCSINSKLLAQPTPTRQLRQQQPHQQ